MSLEMILNECSIVHADNIPTARAWMMQLIDTIKSARKQGISILRTKTELNTAQIAPDYSIAQWRNDSNIDLEVRRFFRSLQTKSPFIDELLESDLQEKNSSSEFSHNGSPVLGLGIAYLLDGLAISLPSAPQWDMAHIHIQCNFLDPETVEIYSEAIEIHHASHPDHLIVHKNWIDELTRFTPWHPEDDILPSYTTADGNTPIANWLDSLKEPQTKNILIAQLSKVKRGNIGNLKVLTDQDGLTELKISDGPGYRIYCGRISDSKLIVLLAGLKGNQIADIKMARRYWKDWKQRHP
jgi:putative addiction module killer protein